MHTPPTARRFHQPAAALLLAAALALSGCASRPTGSGDPLVDVRGENLTEDVRLNAVDLAWEQGQSGEISVQRVREEFKKDIFLTSTGDAVRLRMVEKLINDPAPENEPDTRNFLRLRLPTEQSRPIVELVAAESVARAWTDMTPALVRSYARHVRGETDESRPERAALLALHPGKTIEEIVYEVFISAATKPLDPQDKPAKPVASAPTKNAPPPLSRQPRNILEEKIQSDAWALLVRLDKDGSHRARLLASDSRVTGAQGQDPALVDLRAAAADLKAVPTTGPELDWVRMLRSPGNTVNAAWWRAAAAAVERLSPDQSLGLELRHAEPVRWAAANRPGWLTMNREQLRSELDARLRERKRYSRGADNTDISRDPPDTILGYDAKLAWADLLTILVLDEALSDPSVRAALFEQVHEDRANKQTEYGGALEAVWPDSDPSKPLPGASLEGAFDARLYLPVVPPRLLNARAGDTRFIASEQMLASTPRALAHYHFHVQNERNEQYAGPSSGDMDYAASYARNCLVFTSIKDGVLNADYYQRNGAKIDLGEVRR
jgi:hypothetical protein